MSQPKQPRVRLFAGVILPTSVREGLAQALGVNVPLSGLRWTGPDKLHVTLQFFGSCAADQLPSLGAACKAAAASVTQPFQLRIAGAGAFPTARRAKILWLGIAEGAAELTQLAAALARATAPIGLGQDDEHEYTPHITIGRLAQPRNASALIERLRPIDVTTRVSGFSLVRSHLGQNAYYEPLHEFPFA